MSCLQTTSRKYRREVISGLDFDGVGSLSSRSIATGGVDDTGEVGDFVSRVERLLGPWNRGRITMLESPGTGMASLMESLPTQLTSEVAIVVRRNDDTPVRFGSTSSIVYSGRRWKDSGLTITMKVPGADAPAFLSRSSSVNSDSNGGISSMAEPTPDGTDDVAPKKLLVFL